MENELLVITKQDEMKIKRAEELMKQAVELTARCYSMVGLTSDKTDGFSASVNSVFIYLTKNG